MVETEQLCVELCGLRDRATLTVRSYRPFRRATEDIKREIQDSSDDVVKDFKEIRDDLKKDANKVVDNIKKQVDSD